MIRDIDFDADDGFTALGKSGVASKACHRFCAVAPNDSCMRLSNTRMQALGGERPSQRCH